MKIYKLLLVTLIIVSFCFNGYIFSQIQFKVSPQRSPQIGEGYDSKKGELKTNRAFTNINDSQPLGSTHGSEFTSTFINSVGEDISSSSYDLKISGRYLAYNGGIEGSVLNKFSSNELSVVWYVSYNSIYSKQVTISNPVYSDKANDLMRSNKKEFISQYGDHYVSSITMGHKFSVRYIYNAKSVEEKNEFSALVRAHIGGVLGSADMSAGIKRISERYQSSSSVTMEFINIGGADQQTTQALKTALTNQYDYNQIRDAIINYVTSLRSSSAACLSFEISPYPNIDDSLVPSFNEFLVERFTKKYFDVKGKLSTLENLRVEYSDDNGVVNNLDLQIIPISDYLEELLSSAMNYFNSDQNNRNNRLTKFRELINKPVSPINYPPKRIWNIVWNEDFSIKKIVQADHSDNADAIDFKQELVGLRLGSHRLHIKGKITTIGGNPRAPQPLTLQLIQDSTGVAVWSYRVNIQGGNDYDFNQTLYYSPSSINPGFFWLKVIHDDRSVEMIHFHKGISVTFIP